MIKIGGKTNGRRLIDRLTDEGQQRDASEQTDWRRGWSDT